MIKNESLTFDIMGSRHEWNLIWCIYFLNYSSSEWHLSFVAGEYIPLK